jgi:hypothetical protein
MKTWINPLSVDHAIGLELQIQEFVVRRDRARQQGWMDDVHAAELEIVALRLELAEQRDRELPNREIFIRRAGEAKHGGQEPKTA